MRPIAARAGNIPILAKIFQNPIFGKDAFKRSFTSNRSAACNNGALCSFFAKSAYDSDIEMGEFMHLPKQMIQRHSNTIVVFVHGFMGTPDQFADMMESVYESGISAVSILLPGHGKTGYEFAKCSVEDWEMHLRSELVCYQNYERIYLVGHSIGGLLALNASTEFNIKGVVALSTPLKIHLLNPVACLKKAKLLFLKKNHEIKASYRNAMGIGKPFYRTVPLWSSVMFQPYRLMRKSAQMLSRVTVPTLTIHSKNDETTAFKSAEMFEGLLVNSKHEAIVLENAWHAYYSKNEKKIIVDAIVKFIHN